MAEKNSLWKNIRNKAKQNRASGATPKKPTTEMLRQERKIKAKKAEGGPVNTLEGDLISKVLMNRNRDKDFVQRAYAVGEYPESNMFVQPDANEFGQKNSHLMGWGEDESGQAYMYPEVMNPNNEAVRVPNQYADYISSTGYKKATGIPYDEGGYMYPDGGKVGKPKAKKTPIYVDLDTPAGRKRYNAYKDSSDLYSYDKLHQELEPILSTFQLSQIDFGFNRNGSYANNQRRLLQETEKILKRNPRIKYGSPGSLLDGGYNDYHLGDGIGNSPDLMMKDNSITPDGIWLGGAGNDDWSNVKPKQEVIPYFSSKSKKPPTTNSKPPIKPNNSNVVVNKYPKSKKPNTPINNTTLNNSNTVISKTPINNNTQNTLITPTQINRTPVQVDKLDPLKLTGIPIEETPLKLNLSNTEYKEPFKPSRVVLREMGNIRRYNNNEPYKATHEVYVDDGNQWRPISNEDREKYIQQYPGSDKPEGWTGKKEHATGGYYPTQGPPKALFKGYARGGFADGEDDNKSVVLKPRSVYNTETGLIRDFQSSSDNQTWINNDDPTQTIRRQLPEFEVVAEAPAWLKSDRKNPFLKNNPGLEYVPVETALLPASLPFQASSRLGRAALFAAETQNPGLGINDAFSGLSQKARNQVGSLLLSRNLNKGKLPIASLPEIQRIDPITRSSVNVENDFVKNMSADEYDNYIKSIYRQNPEAFNNPLIEFKSSRPTSSNMPLNSGIAEGLLFKEKFCLPGSECAKASNATANKIYTDITGKEFDVAGNAHNAWHLEDQMTRHGAIPVENMGDLKVGDRLLMGNGVNQSTYVPGYIADPNIRHAGTYAGLMEHEGDFYQMLLESGKNNAMYLNSLHTPFTGPNTLQKAIRPQQFIGDEFGENLVNKNIRYAFRNKPSVATYSSQNKKVQSIIDESEKHREQIKRMHDLTNDEFDEMLLSLVGVGAQETKLNAALPGSKLAKAKIKLQNILTDSGLTAPIKKTINAGKKIGNKATAKSSDLPKYPGTSTVEMQSAILAENEGISFSEALKITKAKYQPGPKFRESTIEPSKGMFRQKFRTEDARTSNLESDITMDEVGHGLSQMGENYNIIKKMYPEATPRQLIDLTTLMWNSPGKAKNKELVDFFLFGKNNPNPNKFNFDYVTKVKKQRNNLIDIQPKGVEPYKEVFRNSQYPEIQYQKGGYVNPYQQYAGGGFVGEDDKSKPRYLSPEQLSARQIMEPDATSTNVPNVARVQRDPIERKAFYKEREKAHLNKIKLEKQKIIDDAKNSNTHWWNQTVSGVKHPDIESYAQQMAEKKVAWDTQPLDEKVEHYATETAYGVLPEMVPLLNVVRGVKSINTTKPLLNLRNTKINPALGEPLGTVADLKNINSNSKQFRDQAGNIVYELEKVDYHPDDWNTIGQKDFTEYVNSWLNKKTNAGGYTDVPEFNRMAKGLFAKEPQLTKSSFHSDSEIGQYLNKQKLIDDIYLEFEKINPNAKPNDIMETYPHLRKKWDEIMAMPSLKDKFLTPKQEELIRKNFNYMEHGLDTRSMIGKQDLRNFSKGIPKEPLSIEMKRFLESMGTDVNNPFFQGYVKEGVELGKNPFTKKVPVRFGVGQMNAEGGYVNPYQQYAQGGYTNPYNQYQDDPYLNYACGGYMYARGGGLRKFGDTMADIGLGIGDVALGAVGSATGIKSMQNIIGTKAYHNDDFDIGANFVGKLAGTALKYIPVTAPFAQAAGVVGGVANTAFGIDRKNYDPSKHQNDLDKAGDIINFAGDVGTMFVNPGKAATEGAEIASKTQKTITQAAKAGETIPAPVVDNANKLSSGLKYGQNYYKAVEAADRVSKYGNIAKTATSVVQPIMQQQQQIQEQQQQQQKALSENPVGTAPLYSKPDANTQYAGITTPTFNIGTPEIGGDINTSNFVFSQGGNITNNSLNLRNTMRNKRFAKGGTFDQYGINLIPDSAGLHHESAYGGVPIGPDALAEGGEAKLQMADGGQYIVSGEVDGANTQSINGETMTQRLKKKLKPYMMGSLASNPKDKENLRRPFDSYSEGGITQIKNNAIQETEAIRMQREGALKYAAHGGKLNKDIEKIVMEEYSAAYGGMLPNKYKGKVNMPNSYAKGGIHIKESKKGTFTAAATKHGKGVQEFAKQVLANKENYSPAMVKKANFAHNASKWNHADGGYVYNPMTQPMLAEGGPIYGDPASEYVYAMGGMYGDPYARGGQIDYTNDMYAGGGPMVSNVKQPFNGPAAQNRGGMYIYADGGMMSPDQQMMQEQQMQQEQMQQQGGGEEQMMQMVQQVVEAIMGGANPEQIMQQLVQSGVPPEQAQQIIQMAMQAMQGQQQQQPMQGQGQMMANGGMMQQQSGAATQIAEALQQGAQPQEILQQLIDSGMPQKQAMAMVQAVMGQLKNQMQQQPQQQMMAPPQQMMAASGGRLPKEILRARVEAHMSPEKADSYVNNYSTGGYFNGKKQYSGEDPTEPPIVKNEMFPESWQTTAAGLAQALPGIASAAYSFGKLKDRKLTPSLVPGVTVDYTPERVALMEEGRRGIGMALDAMKRNSPTASSFANNAKEAVLRGNKILGTQISKSFQDERNKQAEYDYGVGSTNAGIRNKINELNEEMYQNPIEQGFRSGQDAISKVANYYTGKEGRDIQRWQAQNTDTTNYTYRINPITGENQKVYVKNGKFFDMSGNPVD
jgi:hypothetical protein